MADAQAQAQALLASPPRKRKGGAAETAQLSPVAMMKATGLTTATPARRADRRAVPPSIEKAPPPPQQQHERVAARKRSRALCTDAAAAAGAEPAHRCVPTPWGAADELRAGATRERRTVRRAGLAPRSRHCCPQEGAGC